MQKRGIDHLIIVPKCWCTFRAKQEIGNFIAYQELRREIYLYCPSSDCAALHLVGGWVEWDGSHGDYNASFSSNWTRLELNWNWAWQLVIHCITVWFFLTIEDRIQNDHSNTAWYSSLWQVILSCQSSCLSPCHFCSTLGRGALFFSKQQPPLPTTGCFKKKGKNVCFLNISKTKKQISELFFFLLLKTEIHVNF